MIVVDASAAVSALLNDGPARRTLLGQQLHVPHLIDTEVASSLRRQIAVGNIDSNAGWTALDTFRRLGMIRYPASGLLERIWQLRDNVSAYDAVYVALAEDLNCALLTSDAKFGRTPGIRCPVTLVPR
jgi:predicted nucleic acid-binding protein